MDCDIEIQSKCTDRESGAKTGRKKSKLCGRQIFGGFGPVAQSGGIVVTKWIEIFERSLNSSQNCARFFMDFQSNQQVKNLK